jgi:hypothetical protein
MTRKLSTTPSQKVHNLGRFLAQEAEYGVAKYIIGGITSVVSYAFVHYPPKALDWLRYGQIGGHEMELDALAGRDQPPLNELGRG